MKRLLLLPVLMFGLSFACDQPYEDVAGYKIGCPVDDTIEYGNEIDMYGGKASHRILEKNDFFDLEVVFYRDGLLEGVSLGTGDKVVDRSDYDLMIESMKERWGVPVLQDHGATSVAMFLNHQNPAIKMVAASFTEPKGPLVVVYRNQKSLDAEFEEAEKEKARRKESFKGL